MITLAILYFAMLPLGFWWCCCHGCSGPLCSGACRTRPGTITVTISGVTNRFCSKCNEINGTWVGTWRGGSTCIFDTPSTPFTGGDGNCITFFFVAGIVCRAPGKVQVSVDAWINSFREVVWQNIDTDAPALCDTLGVLTLTPSGGAQFVCTFTGATITAELSP